MSPFTIHDSSTAPAASRPILQAVEKSLGFVPNLFGLFASSPAVLEAYTTLSALQDAKTAFVESERQVLYLSISAQNGCEYCVAAHTTISAMKKVPADVVRAVREGTRLANPKLEALRAFAVAVVERRGFAGKEALAAFRASHRGLRSRPVASITRCAHGSGHCHRLEQRRRNDGGAEGDAGIGCTFGRSLRPIGVGRWCSGRGAHGERDLPRDRQGVRSTRSATICSVAHCEGRASLGIERSARLALISSRRGT